MSVPESEFERKMQKIAAEIAPHLLPRRRDDQPLKEFKLAPEEPDSVGMSGMAEVLAAHQWYDATTDSEDPATGCTGCDDWFGSEDALDDGTFATHQADMLSAAGFGPVKEAAAADWMTEATKGSFEALRREMQAKALEDAAEDLARLPYVKPGAEGRDEYERILAVRRGDTDKWLKARAAAVRGEG